MKFEPRKTFVCAAFFFFYTILLNAQESPGLEVRLSCFDPHKGSYEFFLLNSETNKPESVMLSSRSLSREPIPVKRVNGRVYFLLSDQLEEELLEKENIAFSVKVPDGLTRAIIIVLASEKGGKLSPVLLDDSPGKFPFGQSRFINATNAAIGFKIGEHEKASKPGEVVPIPLVKKLNEYNQAGVGFFFRNKKGDSKWTLITEKVLGFNEGQRRVWIAHVTEGAKRPSIATIVDSR